jgi:hypothetical protein
MSDSATAASVIESVMISPLRYGSYLQMREGREFFATDEKAK